MKLRRDITGPPCTVTCIDPKHRDTVETPRRFLLSTGFADREGEPFKAYYCAPCAFARYSGNITRP